MEFRGNFFVVWVMVVLRLFSRSLCKPTNLAQDHPKAYLFNESGTFTFPHGTYRIKILLVGGGGYGCRGNAVGTGGAGQVTVIVMDIIDSENRTFQVKVGKGGKYPTSHAGGKDEKRKESSICSYTAEGGKDCDSAPGFATSTRRLQHFRISRVTRDAIVRDINISACQSLTPTILRGGQGGILINGTGPSAMPGKNSRSSPGGMGYGAGGGSGGYHKLPEYACNKVDGGDGAPGVVYVEIVPEVCRRPVSVIFAIEYATNSSFFSQKRTVHNLIKLMPQRKVGVITFKQKAFQKIPLGQYENKRLFSAINNLKNGNSTEMINLSNVYAMALSAFRDEERSAVKKPTVNFTKTLVMFTHRWYSNISGNNLPNLKRELKSKGVKIVLIGLDEDISETQLQEQVNEDDQVYMSKGDSYSQGIPLKEPYVIDTICRESIYHRNWPATPTKGRPVTFPSAREKTADELRKDYDSLLNYDMDNVHIKNATEIQRVMKIADDVIQNSHRMPNNTKTAPGLKTINFLEAFGLKMASTMVKDDPHQHFETQNLGLIVSTVDLKSLKNVDLTDKANKYHVHIPKEAFKGSDRGSVVVLTSNAVASMRNENDSHIITKLVSVDINPKSPEIFSKPVELVFDVNKIGLDGERVSCEFWDQEKRVNSPHGSWSTEGCKLVSDNDTTIVCHCNHLTSFAVLTRIHSDAEPFKHHAKYLSVITYVGCSLSMLGCLLTIIVHAVLPSLRTERAFIHINLVAAIFFGQAFFFTAAFLEGPREMCFVIAVALYFFYLGVFTWMLVEGLHIYCLVIRVFHSGRERKWLYTAIGWLTPFIITIICASAFRGDFVSTQLCWLSVESGAIWAFVGPAILIIAVNLVILILVLRVTAGVMVKDEIQNRSNRSLIRACITLLPILGLTWLFGILAFNNRTVAFEYLFCIFNSLQGLFIFLFYCVGSSEVRRECRRKLHNYETKRSLRSSQNTSGYNKTKQTSTSKVSRNSDVIVKDKDTQTNYENTLL